MALAASQKLRVVGDSARRGHVLEWPVGQALVELLGDLNSDVREALTDERARLSRGGYPEDPLPALWWAPERPTA